METETALVRRSPPRPAAIRCGDRLDVMLFRSAPHERVRRFTQFLWKSLWKTWRVTALLRTIWNDLAVCTTAGRTRTLATRGAFETQGLYSLAMKIVVADDLPLFRARTASRRRRLDDRCPQRTIARRAGCRSGGRRCAPRSKRDEGRCRAARGRAATEGDRPRRRRRRQRRCRRRQRARHSRGQRAGREQHQRRRARLRADAGAGALRPGRRSRDEGGRWEKRASSATSFAARRSASSGSDASVRRWRSGRGRSACTWWRTIRSSRPKSRAASAPELLTLDELCAAADYLTLHVPSTAETRHLFNDERFARCKPGLHLVNTARGELIDEAALRRAIEAGIVRAPGWMCSSGSRRPIGRWRSFPR